MTAASHSYRFATAEQWSLCLFESVDVDRSDTATLLHPFAPYGTQSRSFPTAGAKAPAAGRFGAWLWRDDEGHLHRLEKGDEEPSRSAAPQAVARTTRIVATSSGLWVVGGTPGTVECYDEDSLSRRIVASVGNDNVVDIADDGRGGVLALIGHDCHWDCARLDCAGHVVERVALGALLRPAALAYLREVDRIVVLDFGHSGEWLRWYPRAGGGEMFNLLTAGLAPCFLAAVLGSDSRGKLFLAGADRTREGERHHALVLDADGNIVGDIPLAEPPTGIAGTRRDVAITTARQLLLFSQAPVVPDATAEARCTIVTPMLRSPATPDGRRWLRVEAHADLPPGTTIQIAHAAIGDEDTRSRWNALLADTSMSRSRRMQMLREWPNAWSVPLVVHGTPARVDFADAPIAAPIFDVRNEYLAVAVTLIAPSGATLPGLHRLEVLYPGRTLMERLPAIYRRNENVPADYVRALVGVLETTTQTLDTRIGSMDRHIHPSTAPSEWLDFIARWLGLPWDDALSAEQKRGIVSRAEAIAQARGTRAGLEALLEALMPGTPPRYRIVDSTADHGFAILGGDSGCGSVLPAMLAGLPASAAELGTKAIVGRLRLPRAGEVDEGTRRLVGRVRVDISASVIEQRKWQPWMYSIIAAMLPATTRLDLRWVASTALRGNEPEGTIELNDLSDTAQLGSDAVTGEFRLPDRQASLSSNGTDTGAHLH